MAALNRRHMRTALTLLRNMWLTLGSPTEAGRCLSRIEEDYSLLERYALQGMSDPQRPRLFGEIASAVASLASRLIRDSEMPDSPSLYYSTLRYERMQSDSLADIIAAMSQSGNDAGRRADYERSLTRLFNRLWVAGDIDTSDAEAVKSLADATVSGSAPVRIMVSALLLGALFYPDDSRLMLLADIYAATPATDPARMIPLTALVLALVAYTRQGVMQPGRKLDDRLAALLDLPGVADDVRSVFMQLIRTRDTERVSRKITDELIPGFIKARSEIGDIKPEDLMLDADENPNPRWEDAFEKTGLADKLREISEMQSEGADVMMSAFSNLKQFPFFNNPANWFLPFDPGHTSLDAMRRANAGFLDLVSVMPGMCDNDKYSMAIMAAGMPGSASGMMSSQIRQMLDARKQDVDGDLTSAADSVEVANLYVRNLYRFFKLFGRKAEMPDPFVRAINPLGTPLLRQAFENHYDVLRVAAEFYFRRGHYAEALELFGYLEREVAPEAQLYQKMGLALQRLGDLERALQMYQNAELLSGDDLWTLRRIASLLHQLERHDQALVYYTRVESLMPDDTAAAVGTALSLMALGRYDEALSKFAKADYLLTDAPRGKKAAVRYADMLRSMTMANLYTGHPARADKLLSRLDDLIASGEVSRSVDDDMAAALVHMVMNRFDSAADRLASAMAVAGDRSVVRSKLDSMAELIEHLGIDSLLVDITVDSALSRS